MLIYQHGSVDLSAIKHLKEVVQAAECRLPGDVFLLPHEVLGRPQSHCGAQDPTPGEINKHWALDALSTEARLNVCKAGKKDSLCQTEGIIYYLSSVDDGDYLSK